MTVSDDDFMLLQTIHKLSLQDYPSPSETVAKAAGLIKAGMVAMKGEVAKNGMADLYIPDEAKWTLLASGRVLKS
jgi:hypothetical protein